MVGSAQSATGQPVRARGCGRHAAIQEKVQGREITAAAPEEPKAQIIDLMEALKASLGSRASRADQPEAARKPAKHSPRAAEAKARPRAVGRRG